MRWLSAAFWPAALTIVSFVWFRVGRAAGIDRGYIDGLIDAWEAQDDYDFGEIPEQRDDDGST